MKRDGGVCRVTNRSRGRSNGANEHVRRGRARGDDHSEDRAMLVWYVSALRRKQEYDIALSHHMMFGSHARFSRQQPRRPGRSDSRASSNGKQITLSEAEACDPRLQVAGATGSRESAHPQARPLSGTPAGMRFQIAKRPRSRPDRRPMCANRNVSDSSSKR